MLGLLVEPSSGQWAVLRPHSAHYSLNIVYFVTSEHVYFVTSFTCNDLSTHVRMQISKRQKKELLSLSVLCDVCMSVLCPLWLSEIFACSSGTGADLGFERGALFFHLQV